jgi:uncharacterized Zn finger protein (UPF0148 family)
MNNKYTYTLCDFCTHFKKDGKCICANCKNRNCFKLDKNELIKTSKENQIAISELSKYIKDINNK